MIHCERKPLRAWFGFGRLLHPVDHKWTTLRYKAARVPMELFSVYACFFPELSSVLAFASEIIYRRADKQVGSPYLMIRPGPQAYGPLLLASGRLAVGWWQSRGLSVRKPPRRGRLS